MKKALTRVWVVGLLGVLMASVASAEVINVDFNDAAGAITSPETYNVLTNSGSNGNNHPLATAGGGMSMAGLVDTTGAATGSGIILESYREDGGITAAGSPANPLHDSVTGIDTNAMDGFWMNDKGTGAIEYGFIVTFTNLTAEAYNIFLMANAGKGFGTWSVTTGIGDPDAEPFTTATDEVQEWTQVEPVDGTIVLTSADTDTQTWNNQQIYFVSLTSTNADPNVNLPPTADDITESVDEDDFVPITLLGSDPEGSNLTYTVSQPANGTVTTNVALPDVIYTPDADFYGDDSFTYTVNDGLYESAPGTVSITVNPVAGDMPVADDLSVAVYVNSSVAITLSGTDPDGNTNLTYTVYQPAHGTVTTNGALPDIIYTPNADYLGDDNFTYTVNDGEFDSAPATVSIMVNPLVPAGTELILNGDFEADGYRLNGLNNQTAAITNWTGPYANGNLRYDTTADGNLPEQPNTAIRLLYGTNIRQNFSTPWTSNSTFAVNLNACEVWWKAATNQLGNGIFVSLRDADGWPEYEAQLIELDGTHGGSGTAYPTWESNQTHSLTFTGADLIAAGAVPNQDLRLNIFSKSNTDSINWIDNVSATMNWGDTPSSVGDISIEIVSGGTEVALTWATQEGWNYGVEAIGDLVIGNWDTATMITSGVPGTGGDVTITNPVSVGLEFYRAYLDNE